MPFDSWMPAAFPFRRLGALSWESQLRGWWLGGKCGGLGKLQDLGRFGGWEKLVSPKSPTPC